MRTNGKAPHDASRVLPRLPSQVQNFTVSAQPKRLIGKHHEEYPKEQEDKTKLYGKKSRG